MRGEPRRAVELGARERERLRLAGADPDATAILARYVRLEVAVGAAAGLAVALSGAIMAAVSAPSAWWALVPVVVGAALGAGARLRSRRWVKAVTTSLHHPVYALSGPARFGREPLKRYPHLPGPAYAELGCSPSRAGHVRVGLMGGQHVPLGSPQAVTTTVISKSRRGWPPTALIAGDAVLLASPAPLTSHLRHRCRRTDCL